MIKGVDFFWCSKEKNPTYPVEAFEEKIDGDGETKIVVLLKKFEKDIIYLSNFFIYKNFIHNFFKVNLSKSAQIKVKISYFFFYKKNYNFIF